MIIGERYTFLMGDGLIVVEAKTPSPVLISVPHDGLPTQTFSGFFEPRTIGHKGRDQNVWPVAKDVLLSANANAVRGLMPRAFIDYNRAWPEGINYYPLTQKEVHTALDDNRLSSAYAAYHASIDRMIANSISCFGKQRSLLIDLHGFKKQPPYAPPQGFDLILGTGNRASIPHGDVDRRFAQFMRERGYVVFLPEMSGVGEEEDYYSADFTTRHHSEKHGINVIQVEIAFRFRERGAQSLGKTLSVDIATFLNGEE